jgi:hypothetical protein
MTDDVSNHPTQRGVAVVGNFARPHQRIQLLGRFGEVRHRLSEFDDARALRGQPRGKLCGLPRIVADAAHLKPACEFQQTGFDYCKVDDVSRRRDNESLLRPALVGRMARVLDRAMWKVIAAKDDQFVVTLEQQHGRRQICLGGQIEADDAGFTVKLVEAQGLVGAALPGLHVVKGLVGLDPDIEMLGHERGLGGRRLHRLAALKPQMVGLDRGPVVRIDLAPRALQRPVIAIVDRLDDAEIVLVLDRALQARRRRLT